MKFQINFSSADKKIMNRKIGHLKINEEKMSKTISKGKNKSLFPFKNEIMVPKNFPKDTLGCDNF